MKRFPSFEAPIRTLFADLSSIGPHATQQPIDVSKPFPRTGVSRLGEYRLLRELGKGGMGIVYEAMHPQHGNRMALKTLPSVDGSALHRFKREFRALAEINHPNLIGLHTLEADGGHWFFTMELIQGCNFLEYVRPSGLLDENRLRRALSQLVVAVMALHSRHIIHRDLKPSNVMVNTEGRVIVLDFGLVLETDNVNHSSVSGSKIAGTPRYMAPEQAGSAPISPASDWYAVGAMLYEALAGKPPFTGSVLQILQDKQLRDPPPIPECPPDLAKLCMDLLARDPQHRPNALAVAKAIASITPVEVEAPSPGGHRLVGRDQQLTALNDAVRTLQRRNEPLTVFISGRSGEGKTSLSEHFLAPLRSDSRFAVMSGRCYDRESVPFKALDSLIDALSSYLRSLPREDAALLIPDDVGTLVQVFPVLQRVDVVAKASDARVAELDGQQVRQRAFRALRSLLTRISRRAQIVWFVDDLQWGDADSAEALFEVLRPLEAPAVLFLGAFRSDETAGSAFLYMWKEVQRKHGIEFADREVKVGPLTTEECVELVVLLLGRDDAEIRRRAVEFAEETRRNPFLLIELVGCFDPDSQSFTPVPLHEVLARKLSRLPEEAGHLLDVVAVSGQALALEEAAQTAGHQALPVATLTRMRNERLIRLIGSDDHPLVDTYHDRVRETVLNQTDPVQNRALHKTLAEVITKNSPCLAGDLSAVLESEEWNLEGQGIERVYDLAYHYDSAGETQKAFVFSLLAAEQARRQSALEVAVNNYAVAHRNSVETSNDVKFRIAEGWSDSLHLLGRYVEANEHLKGAIDLADGVEKKARIDALHGEIAFKQGELDKSVSYYDQGLRRLDFWVPRSTAGYLYGALREALIQLAHTVWPSRLHRNPPSMRSRTILRHLFRESHALTFKNTFKMIWCHLAAMNCAERVKPFRGLTHVYAFHCCIMAMMGLNARGRKYGEKAANLANTFDDVWGMGQYFAYSGIGHFASARYEEGIESLTGALTSFEKAGDLWEVNLAHFHKGCCHFGIGKLAEAVKEARLSFTSSARLGDSRVFCSSYLWARATRGSLPFEAVSSCYPNRPDDVMSTVHGIMAEGHWHTYHGRSEEALKAFDRAATMVRTTKCINSHMILTLPELAGAVRRHADAVEATDPQQCAQLRKRAYRLAKWSTRIIRIFPAAYPLALRERAMILAAYGKSKKALKWAD
ncbi:MAG TPA: protein kinase, partial [Gemmataceae bacterium]|nr:protein kinase [Gemmataceae bacterium]